jgi:hypothetical protein
MTSRGRGPSKPPAKRAAPAKSDSTIVQKAKARVTSAGGDLLTAARAGVDKAVRATPVVGQIISKLDEVNRNMGRRGR